MGGSQAPSLASVVSVPLSSRKQQVVEQSEIRGCVRSKEVASTNLLVAWQRLHSFSTCFMMFSACHIC